MDFPGSEESVRISLDNFLQGLERDSEYGTHCNHLLEKYARRHALRIENSTSMSECLKDLLAIWFVHERFPFYQPGSENLVNVDIDIRKADILSGQFSLDYEIEKSDLKDFLYRSRLPLPAPKIEEKYSFWFYGDPLSTEKNTLGSLAEFSEREFKICDLELEKEGIERSPNLDLIRKQKRLEEIDDEINRINKEIDALVEFYDVIKSNQKSTKDQAKKTRTIAKMAVDKLNEIMPAEVENYQNQLSHHLLGVDQEAAYECCRYYSINKEYEKTKQESQPSEFRLQRMRDLQKEMQAIIDWTKYKRDAPTDENSQIVEDYPALFVDVLKEKETVALDQNAKPFLVPEGTEWYEIRIHFVDLYNVEITISSGKKHERNYKTLGFANKKNGKPKEGWMWFISLAAHQGKPPSSSREKRNLNPKDVHLLSKELKRLFPGIEGNPFKRYVTGRGWEPKILLSLSEKFSDEKNFL